MIVIDNDMDLDILVSPEELKSVTKNIYNYGAKIKPVRLEAITKNSKKKIILEYDPRSRPLHDKRVGSYREEGTLVLKIYEELWRIESSESIYNDEPIQDRYDSENKVIIYSTVNLPIHLKNYFGILDAPPSN